MWSVSLSFSMASFGALLAVPQADWKLWEAPVQATHESSPLLEGALPTLGFARVKWC